MSKDAGASPSAYGNCDVHCSVVNFQSNQYNTEKEEGRNKKVREAESATPRGEQILDFGINVRKLHAHKKGMLEVEFLDEEGLDLGPTQEFFALVVK